MVERFMDLWLWPLNIPDDYWWQRLLSALVFILWFAVTIKLAIVMASILGVIDIIRGDL